ncbi:MAG TPA: sugar transferase [Sphingomicrobium sp.]|jgi:lipopolysaccharide/colanic/teichoic acid biosynthesis glycosyltransferase|nr:sugar transferase [Sphingomicrobium sp.]
MAKRLFDILFALLAIAVTFPIVAIACVFVWAHDGHPPVFAGTRVGRFDRDFRMYKLRTMVPGAHQLGGPSTAASDARLTPLGSALRRFKVDELPQFWNVLKGDMSLVGPRPNVRDGGVDRYTLDERQLLLVRPGITDLASIVFADEGEILSGSAEPHALYDAVIRPWKSRLALLYVNHRSIDLDLAVIVLTALSFLSRRAALKGVDMILLQSDASPELRRICARCEPLVQGQAAGEAA